MGVVNPNFNAVELGIHNPFIFILSSLRLSKSGSSVQSLDLPMSGKTLRLELSILETHFPPNHERFQITRATSEELICTFLDGSNTRYSVQCNISVS